MGSVLNQVLLHQSIIGLESKIALEMLDEYPDIIIGCAGGGSNLGGLIAPFMQDKLLGKANPEIVAVEPASCPSLTRGRYADVYKRQVQGHGRVMAAPLLKAIGAFGQVGIFGIGQPIGNMAEGLHDRDQIDETLFGVLDKLC